MERAAQRSYVIHKSEQIAHNASILTLFRPAFLALVSREVTHRSVRTALGKLKSFDNIRARHQIAFADSGLMGQRQKIN